MVLNRARHPLRLVTAAPSRPSGGSGGIPQRDIRFTITFVRSYAQEFERLRSAPATGRSGKITLRVAEVWPAGKGGRRP